MRKPEPTRPRQLKHKAIGDRVPRKHAQEGSSKKGAPKKGHSAKYCRMCKTAGGSFYTYTHNTAECQRFEKVGTPKASSVKIVGFWVT